MVMLCTSAIIPDRGEGARLKSTALFATTVGYLVVIAAYTIKPGLSSSPRALLGAGVTMAAGTFLMLFVAFVSDAGLKFVALASTLAMPLTIEAQCAIVIDRAGLTAREAEVLELLVRGRTVQDICDELTIAKGTAKHHVSNIYRKLGVGDRRSLYDVVESARG